MAGNSAVGMGVIAGWRHQMWFWMCFYSQWQIVCPHSIVKHPWCNYTQLNGSVCMHVYHGKQTCAF